MGVANCQFSPILITGGYDNTLVFWHALKASRPLKAIPHPQSQINCLAAASDQRVVICGGFNTIRSYDVEYCTPENPQPVASYEGHNGNVTALGQDKDGRFMFSVGEDGTARIWDLRGSSAEQYLFTNEDAISCACLHPLNDKELYMGDHSGRIVVWDLLMSRVSSITDVPSSTTEATSLATINSPIQAIAISSKDPNIIVVANLNGVLAFYSKTQSPLLSSITKAPSDSSIGMSQQQLQPMSLLRTLDAHDGSYITQLRFSPSDNILATASSDGVGLWTVPNALSWAPNSQSSGTVRGFRPRGSRTTSSGQWSFKSKEELSDGAGRLSVISPNPTLSPDMDALTIPSSSTSSFDWQSTSDSQSLRRVGWLNAHIKWVWDTAFSVDGMYLVSGSSDCTAKLWNVSTSEEVLTYAGGHSKPISAVLLLDSLDGVDGLSFLANDSPGAGASYVNPRHQCYDQWSPDLYNGRSRKLF